MIIVYTDQGLANYSPLAKSDPLLAYFVNKVLLECSHPLTFILSTATFMLLNSEMNSYSRDSMTLKGENISYLAP